MNGQTNAGGSAGGLRVIASGIAAAQGQAIQFPQPAQFVIADGSNNNVCRGAALLSPGDHADIGTSDVDLETSGEKLKINSNAGYTIRYIAFA